MNDTIGAIISSLRRLSLQVCARRIAENRGHAPATPWMALRKLFLQERRDWSQPGAPRVGWKRGELAEVVAALMGHGDIAEEWGDVGYYVAQTWDWLWRLYYAVTPDRIVAEAIRKFTDRANESTRGETLYVPVVYVDGRRRVIRCPTCGHILTAICRGYHCGWCDKYFVIVADMLFEEQR